MYEEKNWTLLRIFLTDKDTYRGEPLYSTIVLKCRELGLAGATVLRGLIGYGNSKVIHTTGILSMTGTLPLVLEVCDEPEKIEAALPEFKKMIDEARCGGLITLELARVVHFNG
jgi:PII-like signaling protein